MLMCRRQCRRWYADFHWFDLSAVCVDLLKHRGTWLEEESVGPALYSLTCSSDCNTRGPLFCRKILLRLFIKGEKHESLYQDSSSRRSRTSRQRASNSLKKHGRCRTRHQSCRAGAQRLSPHTPRDFVDWEEDLTIVSQQSVKLCRLCYAASGQPQATTGHGGQDRRRRYKDTVLLVDVDANLHSLEDR